MSPEDLLRAENAALQARLGVAEEALRTIRQEEAAERLVQTAELGEQERFFQRVVEVTPGVLQVFDLEKQCSTFINRSVASMLGYTAEEILALGGNVVPTLMHPDDLARLPAHLERVRALRDDEVADFEHRMRDGSGAWHWFYSRDAVFARDEAGAVIQLIGTAIEITERKQIEEQLRASEERFRAAVGAVGDIIWTNNASGQMEGEQRVWGAFTGQRREDYQGYGWSQAVHPEDAQPTVDAWNLAVAAKQPFAFEHRVRRHDGEWRLCAIRAVPVLDAQGEICEWVGVHTDITERRQSETDLRAANETFRHLVEHSPFGIYTVDADFRVAQMSAGGQKAFANVNPLIGRDFGEAMRILWPEEIAGKIIATFRQVLATGEPYRAASMVEARADIDQVEAYDWKAERITLPDGRPGVVCHFYDLSERQRFEALLRESETRIRMATEATEVGIWEWNVLTNAIRWDAQMFRIYGLTPTPEGFVPYSDWSGAVLPEDLPENERILQDTVRRQGHSRREFRIRRRSDGTRRDIESVETVRLNAQGQVEWVLGTNLDITERKRAEEALSKGTAEIARASRAKDDFLAALSHELRTPLTPVLMTVTALASDPQLSPGVRDQLAMMRRNIELEARLIDDLLDLTRISRGKLTLATQAANLHELIEHTADIVRSDTFGKQVGVTFSLEAARHHALVDPTRIQQVIWNLIKNALKFTPTGGGITVSTRNDAEGWLIVSVADNGIGISAEALPLIFRAFEQGDVSGLHRYGGLGLGLAISYAIVEAHGGAIRAESAGAGLGAVFTVSLATVNAPATSADARSAPAQPARGMRLLVVEDHEATRTVLTRLLTRSGHVVSTAGTVQEALMSYAATPYDAVISDLGLPDGSGLDLMREIFRLRPVPAIALSGYGMEDDLRLTREAGFCAHLVKPVNLDQLKQLLANLPPLPTAPREGAGPLSEDQSRS